MPQVQFYHLTATPLERAVPKLIEKAYGAGFRVHAVLASEEQAEMMNQLLWTFDPGSFVPHGGPKDPNAAEQPVFISATPEAPNAPDLLFVTEGSAPADPGSYRRILDLFDGKNEAAVNAARERWQRYKAAGCELSYWQQTESGGWQQKAVA